VLASVAQADAAPAPGIAMLACPIRTGKYRQMSGSYAMHIGHHRLSKEGGAGTDEWPASSRSSHDMQVPRIRPVYLLILAE
jgi:hypothetical protein